jgi:hypothetical protein
MEYHILNDNGDKIASFMNAYDRNMCLDAFEETFPDCKFIIEGEDEE